MKPNAQRSGLPHRDRRTTGRARQDGVLDPYQTRQKLKEPAGYDNAAPSITEIAGNGPTSSSRRKRTCVPPAAASRDGLPAGILTLHGNFARQHASEILGLARHEEAAEKAEHPLNRIANIERTDAGVVIATTDIHLPRRIGEAIERAYGGMLEMHFDDTPYFMRADWRPPS